jgi:hypothetical protein
MTEREFASALVPLAAGFDKKLEAETIRAYYDRLREFDIDVFQQSVAAALDSGQWFPRVAELREMCESRRKNQLPSLPQLEAGPQPDPKVPDFVKTWIAEKWGPQPGREASYVQTLDEAPEGDCDDCRERSLGPRIVYGKFVLCPGCAGRRAKHREAA